MKWEKIVMKYLESIEKDIGNSVVEDDMDDIKTSFQHT